MFCKIYLEWFCLKLVAKHVEHEVRDAEEAGREAGQGRPSGRHQSVLDLSHVGVDAAIVVHEAVLASQVGGQQDAAGLLVDVVISRQVCHCLATELDGLSLLEHPLAAGWCIGIFCNISYM